ncbi:UDP-3-O-(3-hydroxymyristoyl)glucosamine N-acyltransferase [Sulfitobacter donghicola]|uniref:UDP-3-O-(3-hydroxymyristoyl) glucosamine N-acyltransferase n=1 Tax=Sulfitobacter donghicola DSW-25 = KCTC 12864 = JCM 14565 TaxID=1300350 RepID=A0A073IFM5_9RHOB|nr:UDP-3-O-(3-hydroxymyristoyl)glucosamine N-acyltransferase [Sulfitobacter donghicola]KEJ88519.1 UDP-3-O-(3-hydroxymyristoyl) glucosamine N-acyltransferase [Sulfitobacter donghicola DSW-25 = KCTC 12864 = JCM 14565]KIN69600.1 UDP-3-O-acylglucosamine N-acyltransferase [Sulfitobacter donghicola DSW-25 = KCTC 12864 = JCM 14565]
MTHSVKDIAMALGAEAFGAIDILIDAAAEPAAAGPSNLALAMNPKYAESLSEGKARAALLWEGADWQALGLEAAIIAPRPRYAMASLTKMLDAGQGFEAGIHPTAYVDPEAELAEGVSVGPLAVISKGAKIGANSVIGPQCFIGWNVTIGEGAYLREAVSIGARVTIGNRFRAQPGARIGGDGFSFVTAEPSSVESVRETLGDQGDAKAQEWTRIHSLGAVTIGHDVEIGMGATIDCGTIRDTVIGDGSKLDNQVHLGHNVVIGRNCLICGQVGIAGSATIGDNVVLAGQCGVSDNIFVGDGVIAGGSTKLMSNVPAGRTMLGYPATQMDKQVESYKALRRLPRLMRDISELKKAVFSTDKDT